MEIVTLNRFQRLSSSLENGFVNVSWGTGAATG